jgi:arylsulfatase A-like enzyme
MASEGVIFSRSYCQVPVCGASRASLFTGIRPTKDRFVTYYTRAEKDVPKAVTLGEHFKKNGYHTIANGKVFHHNDDSTQSWTEPHFEPEGHWRDYQLPENMELQNVKSGPAYECVDADDSIYKDGEKMPDDVARKLIQGYYACTTYADAQIGRLLDTLDELNLRENTIVLLIGDHGWNLGEHTLWCKHCNFDTSLRAPMIISAGGMTKNRTSDSLVEFIDLFPTLCDLAGLDKPDQLQGKSLVPILKDPKVKVKDAVFSRYHDGESIRTDRYLYTEWLNEKGQIHSRMLYDHKTDPAENVNIAEKPENATIVSELSQKLAQLRQQPW